jgi:hypothetical protein
MSNVDPDILYALKIVASGGESERIAGVKERQQTHAQNHFATQMELLSDEVSGVVPRSHPLFDLVLTLAVARKMERKQKEPEFKSYLEFPNGW